MEEKKRRRGIRINRPIHIRRLLSRSISEVLNNEMQVDTLRANSYSCSIILKVFEVGEIEDRLARIEERLNA